MSQVLHRSYEKLLSGLRRHGRVLVAFSGGCDSALLLAVARRGLGKEAVLAVTAVSPTLAERERKSADDVAQLLDVHHQYLDTAEMENPSYRANPSNRCFFCKDELFGKLAPMASAQRMILVDGYNASDRGDTRPGVQAARAWSVQHPLDEADLDKRSIRILSRWLGLPTWNKPASPCLSSRIPYGTAVTVTILRQIEMAEDAVRSKGFSVVRVRHYGREARIEVPLKDLSRLTSDTCWNPVAHELRALGYEEIVADPRGFESGRLNAKNLSRNPV